MATLISEPGPFQQKILQHPQMKSVMELVRAQSYAFPENESPYEWAILKECRRRSRRSRRAIDPQVAAAVASRFDRRPFEPRERVRGDGNILAHANPRKAGARRGGGAESDRHGDPAAGEAVTCAFLVEDV